MTENRGNFECSVPARMSDSEEKEMSKTMIDSANAAERYNELIKIELAVKKHIDWLSHEIHDRLHMYNNTRGMIHSSIDHEKIKHEADVLDRVMQNLNRLLKEIG